MPIKEFGSLSGKLSNNLDTTSFVQEPYLRSYYIEAIHEEDAVMKHRIVFTNLPIPIDFHQVVPMFFVDDNLNDQSKQNTAHVEFNEKFLYNDRFVKVNAHAV